MDFVNVLKSKLSKTAKGAVKVSNDAIEYTKLKIKLAETRDTLLPKLMSGEIDVSEVDYE